MAKVQGLQALTAQMRRMPRETKSAIKQALAQSADELVAMQKRLAPVDSGKLRDSITQTWGGIDAPKYAAFRRKGKGTKSRLAGDPDLSVTITAGNNAVRYAHLVEFGTAPHVIRAKNAKALGKDGQFGDKVNHPGAQKSPFFFPAYRSLRKKIKSRITRATRKDTGSSERDAFERRLAMTQRQIELMGVEAATIDQTVQARERARVVVELETAAREANRKAGKDNVEVTEDQRTKIEALADSYAKARGQLEQLNGPLATFARESANVGQQLENLTVQSLDRIADDFGDIVTGTTRVGPHCRAPKIRLEMVQSKSICCLIRKGNAATRGCPRGLAAACAHDHARCVRNRRHACDLTTERTVRKRRQLALS